MNNSQFDQLDPSIEGDSRSITWWRFSCRKPRVLRLGEGKFWAAIPFLFATSFVGQLNACCISLSLQDIRQQYKILQMARVQWVISGYYMGICASALPFGRLCQHIGPVVTNQICCFLGVFANLFGYYADSFEQLVCAMLVVGVLGGGMHTSRTTILAQLMPPESQKKCLMNQVRVNNLLENMVMPAIAGSLTAAMSWRNCFLVAAGGAGAAFLLSFLFTQKQRFARQKLLVFDWIGAVLLLIFMVSLCATFGLLSTGEEQWAILTIFAFLIAFVAFFFREARFCNPIFSKRLLSHPIVDNILIQLAIYTVVGAIETAFPAYAEYLGKTSQEIGKVQTIEGFVILVNLMLIQPLISSKVVDRVLLSTSLLFNAAFLSILPFITDIWMGFISVYFVGSAFSSLTIIIVYPMLLMSVPQNHVAIVAPIRTLTKYFAKCISSCLSSAITQLAIDEMESRKPVAIYEKFKFNAGFSIIICGAVVICLICALISTFYLGNERAESGKFGYLKNKVYNFNHSQETRSLASNVVEMR